MTQLRLAWGFLMFAGGIAIYIDLAHQPLACLTTVPVVATFGAALITIAVTSILNWMFKTAWDERRHPGAGAGPEPGGSESG